MQQTDVLLLGYGRLNQAVASQLKQRGLSTLGMRRTPMSGVLVQDARQPWQQPLRVRAVVIAVSADERSPQGYRDSYLRVAQQIADAMRQGLLQTQAVVWISSTRVLAASEGLIEDDHPATPNDEQGEVLAQCERIIAQLDCRSSCLRLSGIYGPDRQWMLRLWRQGQLSGECQLTNRIHIDDASRAITWAVVRLISGLPLPAKMLVSDLESVSKHDIGRWLAVQHGQTPDSPLPAKGRQLNARFLQTHGFIWRYPSFRQGYIAWLAPSY